MPADKFDLRAPEDQLNQSHSDDWLREILARYSNLNFVQRLFANGPQMPITGAVPAPDGTFALSQGFSTHSMASGDSVAYPTVVALPGGDLMRLPGPDAAYYARRTGNYIPFQNDGDADYFATHYKRFRNQP